MATLALADQCELMAGYIALKRALINNAIATFSHHYTKIAPSMRRELHCGAFQRGCALWKEAANLIYALPQLQHHLATTGPYSISGEASMGAP